MRKTRTRIGGKLVEPRICVICHEPYTPHYQEQESCGARCSRVLGGRRKIQHHGRLPAAFVARAAARRESTKKAIRAECRQRWSVMSEREIEIFEFAMLTGYRRGYAKGQVRQRRQQASAAA